MDDRNDYFNHPSHDTSSDSESSRKRRDEQIRQAPYLPRVQIWARDGGPYTIRAGDQWFHCDDLIINGTEHGQKSKSSHSTGQRQQRRPASSRGQSYQRTRPEKQDSSTTTPRSSNDKVTSHNAYQPQSLPTPKEQAEQRRSERRQQKEVEAQKPIRRERRDSGKAMMDDQPLLSSALVPYSQAPPAQDTQYATPRPKATRPGMPRHGSSRSGSYAIPVRSKGRKNVRFALPK